jgi:hypothetical protein
MADDWIKVRVNLHEQGEVFELTRLLKTRTEVVVFLLIRFWAWADGQTTDGQLPFSKPLDIDTIVGRKGFSDALRSVGWLKVTEGKVSIPNFDRHNGKSAKERALDADRKRQERKNRPDSVRLPTGQTGDKCPDFSGLEERRVEENREKTEKKRPAPGDAPKSEPANNVDVSEAVKAIDRATGMVGSCSGFRMRNQLLADVKTFGSEIVVAAANELSGKVTDYWKIHDLAQKKHLEKNRPAEIDPVRAAAETYNRQKAERAARGEL